MRLLAAILLALMASFTVAGCDYFKSPTAPEDDWKVPFGAPQTGWNTTRGTIMVYTTDNRVWNPATQQEFQRAFDDLLFRLERVVGAETHERLRVDGLNLVLQDPRKDSKYDSAQRAIFCGGPDDFVVELLDYWCDTTGDQAVCRLRG